MKKRRNLLTLLFVSLLATSCGTIKPDTNNGNSNENNNNNSENTGSSSTREDLFASKDLIAFASRGSQGSVDDYYEPVRGLKGKELKDKLKEVCALEKTFSYKDLKTSFQYTDIDPDDPSNLYLMYTGERYSLSKFKSSGFTYTNREHVWPDSNGVGTEGPGTDKHMQRICEQKINGSRGNKGFGYVSGGEQHGINEGNKVGDNLFEPKDEFKGDVARIIFYMATIYGGRLELAQPSDKTRFNYWSGSFTHGKFDDLYKWATDSSIDPVNKFEMNKNNVVDIKYQHNRNPFIDHPEFIEMIYDKNYSGPGALE